MTSTPPGETSPGETSPGDRRRTGRGAGAMVFAACAVCCAGPLLSLLAGIGVLSALGALWIPGLAVLTLTAAGGAAWVLRRRRAASCQPGTGPVDLAMPAPAPTGAKKTRDTTPAYRG